MKAIKIFNIEWDTKNASAEVAAALPTVKGYTVKDDFKTCERIPVIFEKKYGCPLITFSYHEYRIVECVEALLEMCNPTPEKKSKALFTVAGNLSAFGKQCLDNLRHQLNYNVVLRRKDTKEELIPVLIDEILLGIKAITGIDTDKSTIAEMMAAINDEILNVTAVNLKDEDEKEEEDADADEE